MMQPQVVISQASSVDFNENIGLENMPNESSLQVPNIQNNKVVLKIFFELTLKYQLFLL